MRALLCVLAAIGCSSADCPALAARYAAAVANAKQCVPGRDTCTYAVTPVSTTVLEDGGTYVSIDSCMNGCVVDYVNSARGPEADRILAEYRGNECGGPLVGCLCPQQDGGDHPDTCRPTANGGGLCGR